MIVDAINKILSLHDPYREAIGGLEYTTGALNPVFPPIIPVLSVVTLSALVDLHKANFENIKMRTPIFHVTSETTVSVVGCFSDDYGQRTRILAAAVKDATGFKFGEWMSQESFIIAVQAGLIDNDDRAYLLKATSSISDGASLQVDDNGVHQNATAKAGTSLSSEITLKPRVTLKPYRTFRDVEQPESDFIFRVRKGNTGPQLALFEADGGEWKLKAMEAIAKYLEIALLDKDGNGPTVIY